MNNLFISIFVSCFVLQALALDESFRPNLTPDFVEYLEHTGQLKTTVSTSSNLQVPQSISGTDIKTIISDSSDMQVPQSLSGTGGLQPYLTADFSAWLEDNGYGDYNFERYDIPGGSYGGKASSTDTVTRNPVIFFHGNSDRAMGNETDEFSGWIESLIYFTSQGYKESELYVTTWGPANISLTYDQYHSYAYLNYLRQFTEAVLNYTGAEKIDVLGHSMGVTLARKVLKGGTGTDGSISYDLGPPLASKVDKFIALAGGNLGVWNCGAAAVMNLPACSPSNGFYPGATNTSGPSTYLAALNADPTKEANYVISMFSTADDLLLYGDMIWGKYTSQVPTEDDYLIYYNLSHMEVKTATAPQQYLILTQSQYALNNKVVPLYYLIGIVVLCFLIN